jgi:hypothetical protein
VGSSGFRVGGAISLKTRGVEVKIFFANFALFLCKLLKINKLYVEAVGVEPDTRVENAHVIDSGNARIGMFSKIAKSTVRSLYSHFPEFQELPNSTFRRSLFSKRAF